MKKKLISLLLGALFVLSCFSGCANSAEPAAQPTAEPAAATVTAAPAAEPAAPAVQVQTQVTHDEKFGAALMELSQAEFEALGFTLGDSCSFSFSNGYTAADVPYFNGYYVRTAAPVIVAYPGDPCVRITLNMLGIWDEAGLTEGDTVTVTLTEQGKYLPTQEALGQAYSFDRSTYESDEEFCNFRALSGGSLKENFLYRGASPVDNSRGRAAYTDALLAQHGVRFVVDLADSEEDFAAYMAAEDFASDYTAGLLSEGRDVLLDMGSDYQSEAYRKSVVTGLRQFLSLADTDQSYEPAGPVYIHCMEGKDRTGFVCTLLEALAGATYDEMLRDYMLTYQNYFKISAEATPEKYDAVADLYFNAFLTFLNGTEDPAALQSTGYTEDAKNYLRSGGMTDEEISCLIGIITA